MSQESCVSPDFGHAHCITLVVHSDLLQNPLLVPLKQLPGPERRGELCVLGLRWHPAQPWLLAAAADHTLRLYA